MKVEALIEKLKTLDPERQIVFQSGYNAYNDVEINPFREGRLWGKDDGACALLLSGRGLRMNREVSDDVLKAAHGDEFRAALLAALVLVLGFVAMYYERSVMLESKAEPTMTKEQLIEEARREVGYTTPSTGDGK